MELTKKHKDDLALCVNNMLAGSDDEPAMTSEEIVAYFSTPSPRSPVRPPEIIAHVKFVLADAAQKADDPEAAQRELEAQNVRWLESAAARGWMVDGVPATAKQIRYLAALMALRKETGADLGIVGGTSGAFLTKGMASAFIRSRVL